MTEKDILDYIIKSVESIAGCKTVLTYHNEKDEYSNEYTYNTFEIKNRKNWKFGVWIYETKNESYEIYLFGEHKWYIDKFKPSSVAIRFDSFEIKQNASLPVPYIDEYGYNAPDSLWNFGWAICDVTKSDLGSRIKYYWDCKYNKFHFIIGDWFFYAIKNPIKEWYINYGMIVPLTITKILYKIKFGNKISVNIYPTREYFSPKWDLQILYNTKDEDEMFDIYYKINTRKSKRHYGYNKLFLPNWIYNGYVNIVNTDDINDKHRGFYFNLNEERHETI